MGVDIHLDIVDINGTVKYEDIYDGRNTEWFKNLMGNGDDPEYKYLPLKYNNEVPEKIKFTDKMEDEYFDFRYIKASDFIVWYETYNPQLRAGWVTTYAKWLLERKNVKPEYIVRYLDGVDFVADMHFIEYVNEYDGSKFIYDFLKEYCYRANVDNIWIRYCFDW